MRNRSVLGTLCGAALVVAGCAADRGMPPAQPQVMIVDHDVPVRVPCPVKLPAKPDFADDDGSLAAIPDVEAGSRLYRAAILRYRFWVRALEGQLDVCSKLPGG